MATITINGMAPPSGANIALASSNAHAIVPKTVHINPGSSFVTVAVKTTAVQANTTATIKATAAGVSKSAALDDTPVTAAGLHIHTGGTRRVPPVFGNWNSTK